MVEESATMGLEGVGEIVEYSVHLYRALRRLPVMAQPLVRGMAIGMDRMGEYYHGSEEELMGFTSMSTEVSEALIFARRGVAEGRGRGILYVLC